MRLVSSERVAPKRGLGAADFSSAMIVWFNIGVGACSAAFLESTPHGSISCMMTVEVRLRLKE